MSQVEGTELSPSLHVQRNSVTAVRCHRVKLSICVLPVKEVKKAPNIFSTQFKNLPKPRCKPTCYLKCHYRESVRASQPLNRKILGYFKVISSE
jgi:hypothetical protein